MSGIRSQGTCHVPDPGPLISDLWYAGWMSPGSGHPPISLRRRRAITALYAFCREVDDIVDECTDTGVARTKAGLVMMLDVERLVLDGIGAAVAVEVGQ